MTTGRGALRTGACCFGTYSDAGFGVGYTYCKHHTQVRIDHVLFDEGWRCRRCWVGPDSGSGHSILVADLER